MCRQTQYSPANPCLASLLISNESSCSSKYTGSCGSPLCSWEAPVGGPGNHCPPVPCQLFWIVLWSSHHTSHTRDKDTSAYYSSQNLGESIWFVYTVLTGTEQNNGEFPFSLGSHPSSNSGVVLSMNSSRLVSSLDCSNFSFQVPCTKYKVFSC